MAKEKIAETTAYEELILEWGTQNDYEVVRKIGRGKYSEVFQGNNVHKNQICVLKILKPVRKKKIKREIKILQTIAGGPNIIYLIDVVLDALSKTPTLVFEYIEKTNSRMLNLKLEDFDLRFYIYELFRALEFCNSHGIMHRDLKPQNMVIDHKKRLIKLIDWGLAEFYQVGKEYNVRVASRYFKSPELLVELQIYDYSLDSWSLGCMLAGFIFKIEPFFCGNDNIDQLMKIIKVLGWFEFSVYILKYSISSYFHWDSILGKFSKKPWTKFAMQEEQKLVNKKKISIKKSNGPYRPFTTF